MIDLEKQYSEHKVRLYKHFLVIDDPELPGTYIPATIKHLWGEKSTLLAWGDSTIMMGYYIGMLATEYHLNKSPMTLNELKNALLTLDRLDKSAEKSFDPNAKEELNGFFIRDDVHGDILQKYTYLKNEGIRHASSDYFPYDFKDGKDQSRNKEMSQDQFWHLILGLSLVVKLVDNEYCVKLAQNFTERVMNYIQKNDWYILNPVTNQKVERGSDVRLFSYGFCKATNFINSNINWKTFKRFNLLNKGLFLTSRKIQRTLEKLKLNEKDYSYLSLSTVGDIGIDKDMSYLTYHLDKYGNYEHFILIYNILHNKGDVSKYKKFYEDLLEKVPLVHNNYNESTGKWNVYEWSSTSRLVSPEDLGDKSIHFNGEFNGIDFMLLYNLYKIVYK